MKRLEERLASLARAGETITYGALARELDLRMADLTAQLESLMEIDAAQEKPFRAALCAARLSPENLPAPGFFAKAAALGRPATDPHAFTATERANLRTNAQ